MQIHSDNTPSVAWLTKMATKTANSDAARRLVRGLALRQRMLHSVPVSITHVAGANNNLADIASRAITHLDDDHAFLTHFDNLFPLQERFWQRASPPPAQLSNVISTLRGQRLTMQRWTVPLEPPAGVGGSNTVPIVEQPDPWLRDTTPAIRSQLHLGFAPRTRTGFFGKGWQVGAQTVEKALRHVAQAFVLEGYPNPRRAGSGSDLALPFTHLLKSFRVRDPAPKPHVALPVHAIDQAMAASNDPNASPREAATAHLIVMAFYFLLRVGEYTLPPGHRSTCTVQFCICNIRFWQGQICSRPPAMQLSSQPPPR